MFPTSSRTDVSYVTKTDCTPVILRTAAAVAMLGWSVGILAEGTAKTGSLVEFDAPGASNAPSLGTTAYANNDLGTVVGYYVDANVVPHAFVRAPDGKITSFDAPGAGLGAGLDQGTVAYSINDAGVIAGELQDPGNVFHAFIRFANGSYVTFDAPGAGSAPFLGTQALDINAQGETAGTFYDASGLAHGFIRSRNGMVTPFEAPDASPAGLGTTVCQETCLGASGGITGWYFDANDVVHGYVRASNGSIREFDAPKAGSAAFEGTFPSSIDAQGLITGYVVDSNNIAHGFIRTPNGHVSEFDAPGAAQVNGEGTTSFAINAVGAVTGDAYDANNVMHGFESLLGYSLSFDAPDAGKGSGQGTRPSTNNVEGAVAGWYIDANGSNHGFVWLP